MKAISLWQPWASLVAIGAKTIETRSWATNYRGPLLIHAAKRPMGAAGMELLIKAGFNPLDSVLATSKTSGLPLGAIIAICRLDDCSSIGEHGLVPVRPGIWGSAYLPLPDEPERSFGDYKPGRFAWLLKDVRPIKPSPFVGRQRIFNVYGVQLGEVA